MTTAARPRRPPLLWFPLLAKELTEKANRLRTYWIRTTYALAFFTYFGFEGYQLLQGAAMGLSGLGTGAAFFQKIYRFQLIGTLLFLPALMSALITQEKERASLQLLLTTDLAPWRIILQKFTGGLLPMLALQLTALPMTAVAYSLGGVASRDLWTGAALILAHTLNTGAFCLTCSAYFRSSASAFLAAYLLGAILLGLLLLWASARAVFEFPLPPDQETQERQLLLVKLLPLSALLSLVLATRWLRSRAELGRRNRLRALFLRLDQGYHWINDKLGSVTIACKPHTLPEDEPVRWRELHQRSIARPQYLIRIGLVVEIVAVVVILFVADKASPWNQADIRELTTLFLVLWALYALVLIVQGANIVSSERTQQTLDVLLTTPLSGRAIVREKSVVYRRIALMAMVPLGTVCWTEAGMESLSPTMCLKYGLLALLAFLVVTPFVYWLAVTIGLHVRSRFKALLITILILLGLIALPAFVKPNTLVSLASPATAIVHNEIAWDQPINRMNLPPLWTFRHASRIAILTTSARGTPLREAFPSFLTTAEMAAGNLLVLGTFTLLLRRHCLRRADALLGRAH